MKARAAAALLLAAALPGCIMVVDEGGWDGLEKRTDRLERRMHRLERERAGGSAPEPSPLPEPAAPR